MKSDKYLSHNQLEGFKLSRPVEITEMYTAFLRVCTQPFYFEGELHEPWEMVYVRRGQGDFTADDRVYRLGEGDIIFHKPMEFHKISADEKGVEFYVCSFDLSGTLVYRLKDLVFSLDPMEKALMEELINWMVELDGGVFLDYEYRNCLPMWQKEENSPKLYRAINMMETIIYSILGRSRNNIESRETENTKLYTKVVGILEENIDSSIGIEEIADICMVSPSTVKNCFSRHAGCGVHKYFLKMKIRAAAKLLREGNSVSEVSNTLGFNNPNYFTCVFKRETGRRPSDYRKN